ncbi:MAG: zinc-binding dehydrogenase [Bacilli bacterium]|nr:zinc-binding dehydrogenase [Bacilli bacterium]
MINQSYRLISPRQIRIDFMDEHVDNTKVIIRPKYLSICAADQRYYTGSRGKEVLNKKLPMALIHEAVGEVIYDPKNEFKIGSKVVLIPNTPIEHDKIIKENYLRSSKFRASGFDGFMQSIVAMDRNRVIEFKNIEYRVAVLLELMSVAMNALEHFQHYSHLKKQVLGVWGNGNLGFVTALVLKKVFPNAKIVVFGTRQEKLNYFSFADETYLIDNIPVGLTVDHAFECVGGSRAEDAINQIIDHINPQGTIALMGVSENKVPINTRMVLEKGLSLIGNSRSSYEDFDAAVNLIENNSDVQDYLSTIISEEVVVKNIEDIHKAFENDLNNDFKTVMKWEI